MPAFAVDTPYCTTTGSYQVCTDQEDYSPTFIVHIAGSGFASDYSYMIKVTRPDGSVVTGDGSFGEWPSYYDIAVTDADGNFQFDYILDGILGQYNIEVLDSDNNVVATHTFLDNKWLNVYRTNGGGGTITSSPSGIDCGSDCSENFPNDQNVILTETPNTGGTFAGWSGACSGTSSTCAVTMSVARDVTATFTFPLTVSKSDGGTVTSSPSGIDCGSTCSKDYV
jgi:hypothetical protein